MNDRKLLAAFGRTLAGRPRVKATCRESQRLLPRTCHVRTDQDRQHLNTRRAQRACLRSTGSRESSTSLQSHSPRRQASQQAHNDCIMAIHSRGFPSMQTLQQTVPQTPSKSVSSSSHSQRSNSCRRRRLRRTLKLFHLRRPRALCIPYNTATK